MIRLKRVREKNKVHKNFFGDRRVELNQLLIEQKLSGVLNNNGEGKWDSNIWKQAKKQLLAETHNKCAYCETPLRVVAYGDVEHFRPKSIYWWLAYCYENYLVACTACNQEYKKDKFDIREETKRLTAPAISLTTIAAIAPFLTPDPIYNAAGKDILQFEAELLNEWALIVQPYMEDPSIYYAYEADIDAKEISVVASKPAYKDVLEASENIFGINRQELKDLRFQWYCFYMTFRRTLTVPNLPIDIKKDNENRIQEMIDGKSPYAGMIRYFESKSLTSLPWDTNIKIMSMDIRRPTRKNIQTSS